MGLARFGLLPAWAKENKIGPHTYNARAETPSTKPSCRTAWQRRQYGIVLLDCFFEPHCDTGRAVKWRIKLASAEPMATIWKRYNLMTFFKVCTDHIVNNLGPNGLGPCSIRQGKYWVKHLEKSKCCFLPKICTINDPRCA